MFCVPRQSGGPERDMFCSQCLCKYRFCGVQKCLKILLELVARLGFLLKKCSTEIANRDNRNQLIPFTVTEAIVGGRFL